MIGLGLGLGFGLGLVLTHLLLADNDVAWQGYTLKRVPSSYIIAISVVLCE